MKSLKSCNNSPHLTAASPSLSDNYSFFHFNIKEKCVFSSLESPYQVSIIGGGYGVTRISVSFRYAEIMYYDYSRIRIRYIIMSLGDRSLEGFRVSVGSG